MPATVVNHDEEHGEIRLLLPWYVNHTLGPQENRLVDEHLRNCVGCRHEITGLRRLAEACVARSDLELAAESSFARLASRLPSRKAVQARRSGCVSWLKERNQWHGLAYALAALLVLAVVPWLGSLYLPWQASGAFHTLSSRPAPQDRRIDLRVVFAPSASQAEIAAILADFGGVRVGEPNSAGAIDVALETGDGGTGVERAVALLRMRDDVVLAEPVVQP